MDGASAPTQINLVVTGEIDTPPKVAHGGIRASALVERGSIWIYGVY